MRTTMLAVMTALLLLASADQSFADRGHRHRGYDRHETTVVVKLPPKHARYRHRGRVYHSHRGRYYRHTRRGYVVVARPPRGLVVSVLPSGWTVIRRGGHRYYRVHNVYYRPVKRGYVVVDPPAEPVVVTQTPKVVQSTPLSGGYVKVTVPALNVRSGPGQGYGVLAQTYQGHELYLLEQSGSWLRVRLPTGKTGWVMEPYTHRITTGGAVG